MSEKQKAVESINNQLKEYRSRGWHVPGVSQIGDYADFLKPKIRIVEIDTVIPDGWRYNSDIYLVTGGKFGLGRGAVNQFRDAGNITLKTVRAEHTPTKGWGSYTAIVLGKRYDIDGTLMSIDDLKVSDLDAYAQEMKQLCQEQTTNDERYQKWSPQDRQALVDRLVVERMTQKKKHAMASTLTGAQARVIQKLLGLAPAYTREELEKPFVILSMVPVVDTTNPEINAMVTAHMLGIEQALYPRASVLPQPSPVDCREVANSTDLFEPLDTAGHEDVPVQRGLEAKAAPEKRRVVDFEEYPRPVKLSILRTRVKDEQMRTKLADMKDAELVRLFVDLERAA